MFSVLLLAAGFELREGKVVQVGGEIAQDVFDGLSGEIENMPPKKSYSSR